MVLPAALVVFGKLTTGPQIQRDYETWRGLVGSVDRLADAQEQGGQALRDLQVGEALRHEFCDLQFSPRKGSIRGPVVARIPVSIIGQRLVDRSLQCEFVSLLALKRQATGRCLNP